LHRSSYLSSVQQRCKTTCWQDCYFCCNCHIWNYVCTFKNTHTPHCMQLLLQLCRVHLLCLPVVLMASPNIIQFHVTGYRSLSLTPTGDDAFFQNNSWMLNNDHTFEIRLPFYPVNSLTLCKHMQNHAAHLLCTANTNITPTGISLLQAITHWHHHTRNFWKAFHVKVTSGFKALNHLHEFPVIMFYISLCTGNCMKSTPSAKLHLTHAIWLGNTHHY
jgi:hypothetical protein